jgi:hypothetical protein
MFAYYSEAKMISTGRTCYNGMNEEGSLKLESLKEGETAKMTIDGVEYILGKTLVDLKSSMWVLTSTGKLKSFEINPFALIRNFNS